MSDWETGERRTETGDRRMEKGLFVRLEEVRIECHFNFWNEIFNSKPPVAIT